MAKVLMFHRVLPKKLIGRPNAYTDFGTLISQEYLTKIVQWLSGNDYKFLKISDIINYNAKDKAVALTFDDGYMDNFSYAYPILKQHKATATFFPLVHTSLNNNILPLDIYYQCVDELKLNQIERSSYIKGSIKKKFYWSEPNEQLKMLNTQFKSIPKKSRVHYMSAEQLVALANDDFEIGSHGVSHSLLTADYMTKEKVSLELEDSKKSFESLLGKEVTAYCFPAGLYNLNLIKLAKQVGYTSVCLITQKENEKPVLPAYTRIFVKPNSFDQLKMQLENNSG